MIRQSLKGRTLSPLMGVLVIIGLAVSIVLVSWIERAIALSTGFQYGSFAVWGLIVAEVLAVLRLSGAAFRYSLGEGRFFVERLYGGSARVVHDIPLSHMLAFGPKEDVFRRYGNAQAYEKAVVSPCELPEMAIAYRKQNSDAPALLVIQPDEAMAVALRRAVDEAEGRP